MSLYTRPAPVPTAVKILATYEDTLGTVDSMSFSKNSTWMAISASIRTVRDVWLGMLDRLARLVFISRSSSRDMATTVNKTVWTQHTAQSMAAMSVTMLLPMTPTARYRIVSPYNDKCNSSTHAATGLLALIILIYTGSTYTHSHTMTGQWHCLSSKATFSSSSHITPTTNAFTYRYLVSRYLPGLYRVAQKIQAIENCLSTTGKIFQSSVATHLRCGGPFNSWLYCKFTADLCPL